MMVRAKARLIAFLFGSLLMAAHAQERQVTSTPKNHELDQNDNFSPDGRFLCYDARETFGFGIDRCRSIEKAEIATGAETILYMPPWSEGEQAAPGIGAASFSPVAEKVIFIHGPPLADLAKRGAYGKPNRNGAVVDADGSQKMAWLDCRDIETSRATLPGAHRGGTHRHEFSPDGKRIGSTYDDAILGQYDRTIGYMEPIPRAPGGAHCWFAILVAVAPKGTAKPGEIEKAADDSWVGREGRMRAFIGKVREADGVGWQNSLFVVDVPASVDITTSDSGDAKRFPSPPKGVKVRRLTHSLAAGIVRGSPDGSRIAYYANDENGQLQVFVIASDGSDEAPDAAKRPMQATRFATCAGPGVRWHPSGDYLVCTHEGGIAAVCVKPGADFGKTRMLTPPGAGRDRSQLCVSQDGKLVAYVRPVAMSDGAGKPVKNYAGLDFKQIFVADFAAP